MKKGLVGCLIVGAFTVVMVGIPLQLFHVDSAYAIGWHPSPVGGGGGGEGNIQDTPEPATLAALVTGIAGVGTYLAIRRGRNGRKK